MRLLIIALPTLLVSACDGLPITSGWDGIAIACRQEVAFPPRQTSLTPEARRQIVQAAMSAQASGATLFATAPALGRADDDVVRARLSEILRELDPFYDNGLKGGVGFQPADGAPLKDVVIDFCS